MASIKVSADPKASQQPAVASSRKGQEEQRPTHLTVLYLSNQGLHLPSKSTIYQLLQFQKAK